MGKHSNKKGPQRANGSSGNAQESESQAQHRRDRQQIGVAKPQADEAELLFPALHVGVFSPEQLVRQARYVLERAHVKTERHAEGEISKKHADQIISCVRRFAKALDQVGVKVPGLFRVKQSHYLDVMALWEQQSPGEACTFGWRLSLLRRLFTVIGRKDVIPRRNENIELLRRRGIEFGTDRAFLLSKRHFDWASSDTDVEIIFQAIRDPGRRVAAKVMHYWGMSLLEVASWMVDPAGCSFVRVEGTNEHRRSREAEFSCDPAFAAKQMATLKEARNYCLQQDRLTIRPSDLSPGQYANQLRQTISRAFKQCPDQELRQLRPMQLRDGFFNQVIRDDAGMSLEDAKKRPRLAPEDRRRVALAWNDAKRQLGVQRAKAANAHKGMPTSWSQSLFIARRLRSVSPEFAKLRVGDVWVGDVDASAGKCLFVQLLEGAQPSALLRLQELIEQAVPVKLRIVRVLGPGDVPDGAARVMVRPGPDQS